MRQSTTCLKKGFQGDEIQVFGQKRVNCYHIPVFSTEKQKYSRGQLKKVIRNFRVLNPNFLVKKGHSEIWSEKFCSIPPKSVPSLRLCCGWRPDLVTLKFCKLNFQNNPFL